MSSPQFLVSWQDLLESSRRRRDARLENWAELSTPPIAFISFFTETKKADVAQHPEAFHHAGLLLDEPSSFAGVLFIQSSDNLLIARRYRL